MNTFCKLISKPCAKHGFDCVATEKVPGGVLVKLDEECPAFKKVAEKEDYFKTVKFDLRGN